MPLLDHFHPPLSPYRHWESFHSNWAGAIADALNEQLPEGYFAEETTHQGQRVEIDVATFQDPDQNGSRSSGGTATLGVRSWSPPAAVHVLPAAFVDTFAVKVYSSEGGAELVAAVELVSPGNKDRAAHERAFAIKSASYLAQGISLIVIDLIVIDIVTSRGGNLHNEIMRLLQHGPQAMMPNDVELYAVAYRPIVRAEKPEIDVWPEKLSVGNALPTLTLALNAETCIPVDLEATYTIACQRRRLG